MAYSNPPPTAQPQPGQVGQPDLGFQQPAGAAAYKEESEHAQAQPARQAVVEAPRGKHRQAGPDPVLEPGDQRRQAPEQGNDRPQDRRHRHHMDALVQRIAVIV